ISMSPVKSPIWRSMLTTVPPRISVLVVICPCSFASGVVSWSASEGGESSYGVANLVDGGDHNVLECVSERQGHALRCHPSDRRIEQLEALVGDDRCDRGGPATLIGVLLDQRQVRRAGHRGQHGLGIQRHQAAQI